MRLLQRISPHLRRAVDLHLRLTAINVEHRAAEAALDAMALGVIVTDRAGQLLFANCSAREICKRRDGLSLGALGACCAQPAETADLRHKIHAAATVTEGRSHATPLTMAVSRPSGLRPYIVTVAPLRGASLDLLGGRGAAAIFIADPEQAPEAPHALLERIYGLTPAEARLAVALGAGETLDRIAAATEVRKATLRTQLQQVFRKTGTARQADLVLLISRHQPCRIRAQDEP